MMAPLETGTAQHLALREKAKNWAAKFRPQHLLCYDVLPLIKATALKTLEYVMPLSTIAQSDWVSIMSPILQASLHKAAICRSFPRVVVFAALKYQGLGIPHPFALQVFHHLSVLMRHLANRTKTGQYLEANLQSHQLETEPTNTGILASKTFDQEELLWLNWCRQFFQVTTLSELTTADGCSLTAASLAGQPSGHFVNSYNWPRTRCPGPSHWGFWQCGSPSYLDGAPPWGRPKGLSRPSPTDSLRHCQGHSPSGPTRSRVLASLDPTPLKDLAADMDDNWGWVPEYIYIEGDKQVLLAALEKGKLQVISDGSFKQPVGTAAVQLQT
ncbi:unnamed protein product [Cylindrotheca closterium]|uniref:Uncharacterized protein n=1 Tax=Cylindrotheca closterium TaxID=2856 RepID=A0AAD2CJ91_9STRA|nr:unnamed protein product [Cylindrotheca closterium]